MSDFHDLSVECLSNENCDEKEQCEDKTCVDPCHDYDGCNDDNPFCKVVDRTPKCFGSYLFI